MLFFCIALGKVDFNIVPFPISHLRETVIHSWAANSMDMHHILWAFQALLLPRHISNHLWIQAYLRPQTPAAWRISRSQELKNPKLAWPPTSLWYDKSQHTCPNVLTILVWLNHRKINKYVYIVLNWEFHGNINKPSGNPPASVGFQNQWGMTGNAVGLQFKNAVLKDVLVRWMMVVGSRCLKSKLVF